MGYKGKQPISTICEGEIFGEENLFKDADKKKYVCQQPGQVFYIDLAAL